MLPLSARPQSGAPAQFLPLQRWLMPVILVGLILVAAYAVVRGVEKVYEPRGAIDLHPYWFYGHFVRAGINPYTAYAEGAELPEAVEYIDGSVVAPDAVQQPRLAMIPANTAPLLFVFTLLAYFPWEVAKSIWLVVCMALVLATPWLALRLVPPTLQLTWMLQWVIALSYYAMKGTRVAIANGQPSILVFFLMIVTLLLRRNYWLWAGLALGVAMSKYSIALPVALFLLFEKRFRLLAVAFAVQVIALLAVAALDGSSILKTIEVYLSMLTFYSTGEASVHLGYTLRELDALPGVVIAVGTMVTLASMIFSYRRGWQGADLLAVNSLLALWTLLATYHRVYDMMLLLLFWILCLSAVTTWQLPRLQSYALGIFWLASLTLMCLPGENAPSFFPRELAELLLLRIEWADTLLLVASWAVNLWLVAKTPRVDV
jgi:hypothetical protein